MSPVAVPLVHIPPVVPHTPGIDGGGGGGGGAFRAEQLLFPHPLLP